MNLTEKLAYALCQTLFDKGYVAYFAGGWVRDLLLKQPADEIDIATNAPPDVIQSLFEKTVPVGVAFGVIIVVIEGVQFEISTFRKDHAYHDGRHPDGVDFSTPQKDAERRDFTINGMFYDPLTQTIHDYVNGQQDLKLGIIRAIGNAKLRFEEDRLRMVRAVRFSARFGFTIEEQTAAAIHRYAPSLFPAVSIERIWQEFCKMAAYPHFDHALVLLHTFGLLQTIFPDLKQIPIEEVRKRTRSFPYFPKHTPTLAFLLELFPEYHLQQKLDLWTYLKLSNKEKKLIEFFDLGKNLLNMPDTERWDWAHFYAHPQSELFLEIQAAKILPPKRSLFIQEHQNRKNQLRKHIERIYLKRPLVSSKHLMKNGIKPGKEMGEILKKAERIAINEDLQLPDDVLKRL